MKLNLKSLYCVSVVLIIMRKIKPSDSAGNKRLFQKIDDLEFEMRKESVRRLREIRELRQTVDRIEEQLNNSLDLSGGSDTQLVEGPQIDTQQPGSSKIEEVLGAFKILKRGFTEEKKVTSRLRRHVTRLQSQLDEQRNVSRELTNGVANILEAVTTMSEVLNVTNLRSSHLEEAFVMLKSDIVEAVENVTKPMSDDIKNMQNNMADVFKGSCFTILSEFNNTNQRSNRIEETLQSQIDTLNDIVINNNKMNVYLNKTLDGCNNVSEISESLMQLRLQLTCHLVTGRPSSCKDILNAGCGKSDVYLLSTGTGTVTVYCDLHTDGGGWVVFQRRQDGSVDFFRDWADYKNGFGSLTGEFWLGNDNINRLLTTSKQYELRIDMGDFEGNIRYAKYSTFRVGPESEGYKLEVCGYSGNAGDSLKYHDEKMFKTKDHFGKSDFCTRNFQGGWWYNNCHHANLNGLYNSTSTAVGVNWKHWKGYKYSLRFVEMKFRERN